MDNSLNICVFYVLVTVKTIDQNLIANHLKDVS